MAKLAYRFANKHQILLLDNKVYITSQTPLNVCQQVCAGEQPLIDIIKLDKAEFNKRLTQHYEQQSEALSQQTDLPIDDLDKLANELSAHSHDLLNIDQDAPIIRMLNSIIAQAIKKQASDIHFDTYEQSLLVRFRIDGILHNVVELSPNVALAIISRLKVMSKLDIAEKRLPQDGRISVNIGKHHVDLRVSTLPINHGERVVLRILDKRTANLHLPDLGMSATALTILMRLLQKPHGVILVTGPTGSGKTTSLYAALRFLDQHKLNIMTVEDPIEFDLSGISQTPINAKIGRSFAGTLRSILRQDPDVIMIGEIRDAETAQIAIQASLTGHLVLSTLHTNTAVGAITRLRDMGIEPFLLSSSLTAVLAQRLVRKLCNCKQPYQPLPELLSKLGLAHDPELQLYQANGCESCLHTGYSGRIGIYEVIEVDESLKRAMIQNQDEQDLQSYAALHYQTIAQDGIAKIMAGLTSVEEVMRVVHNTHQPEISHGDI